MSTLSPIAGCHLRVARPTDNIESLKPFYIDGLGFDILYEAKDHDGFDVTMLGFEGMGYHLEFVHKQNHAVGKAPTQDNLLVFYLPEIKNWEEAVARMKRAGFNAMKSFNPYWDIRGKTYEDADGYRIVLQNAAWANKPLT